jgi:hypothetical protein
LYRIKSSKLYIIPFRDERRDLVKGWRIVRVFTKKQIVLYTPIYVNVTTKILLLYTKRSVFLCNIINLRNQYMKNWPMIILWPYTASVIFRFHGTVQNHWKLAWPDKLIFIHTNHFCKSLTLFLFSFLIIFVCLLNGVLETHLLSNLCLMALIRSLVSFAYF